MLPLDLNMVSSLGADDIDFQPESFIQGVFKEIIIQHLDVSASPPPPSTFNHIPN